SAPSQSVIVAQRARACPHSMKPRHPLRSLADTLLGAMRKGDIGSSEPAADAAATAAAPAPSQKPIQVYLRHCYQSPNAALPSRMRPPWFDKAAVFRNFKRTIDPDLASYLVIYDNRFGPRADTFLADETNCIEITAGTEAGSFLATLDIALDDIRRD